MTRNPAAQYQREQLHRAAREGDLAAVEDLIRKEYPVNRFDDFGNTPLHYAVASGNLAVVDLLLKAGANVNANDERVIGNTPLSDNIDKCSFEMVKRLINAGADPIIPGWMQLTAVDRAAKRTDSDKKKIQQLLSDTVKQRRK
jgi:ankyrin repeat protein